MDARNVILLGQVALATGALIGPHWLGGWLGHRPASRELRAIGRWLTHNSIAVGSTLALLVMVLTELAGRYQLGVWPGTAGWHLSP